MNLQEFKEWIADKTFRSTDINETTYKFIAGTTLQVNDNISVHYDIYEEHGSFLLDHKNAISTKYNEPLKMLKNEPLHSDDPISFAMIGRISDDFYGTWIEILTDQEI